MPKRRKGPLSFVHNKEDDLYYPAFKMFKISQQKYSEYVHYIKQKGQGMLQTNVIVSDEKCGCFKCGKVSKYIGNQMYPLTLTERDGAGQQNQQANHMFLRKTRPSTDVDLKGSKTAVAHVKRPIADSWQLEKLRPTTTTDVNFKYVIGREKDNYLPGEACKTTDTSGKTTPDKTIAVKFCNHEETFDHLEDVYPINQNYFDLAVDVFKSHQKIFTNKRKSVCMA